MAKIENSGAWERRGNVIILHGVYADELDESFEEELRPGSRCLRPLGGAAPKGLFTAPMRDGTRWYTPKSGDNRWRLAKKVLVLKFAAKGIARAPRNSEIRYMSQEIQRDDCNKHLTGKWFLPRFDSTRFAGRGQHYGAIHIPLKF